MGRQAQNIVNQFLSTEIDAFMFSPKAAEKERNQDRREQRRSPMTPSQAKRKPKRSPKRTPGDHYTKDAYIVAIRRACEKFEVPRWSPNQLRHNAATRFRKEYGLEVAQIMLGHKSADVTQIYAERDKERAMAVVAKIG